MQLKNKSFCIATLGCKVNLFESNNFVNQMNSLGCRQTNEVVEADICIINTCCVTNKAVSKSRYFINRAIRSNKTKLVVIVGCLSQLEPNLVKHPKVGIILGSKYKDQLVDLIQQYCGTPITKVSHFKKNDKFENLGLQLFSNNTRAFLKIQDGCDYMCAYCIIPFVRGRQRSLSHIEVLNHIREQVKQGYGEIVLTGVNTAGYSDGQHYGFYQLLKDINKIKGNFRVRISSIEPFQISHQIIDLLASNPARWCKHLHICLQSGSDKILSEMKRRYTVEHFIELCKYARRQIKNVAITTDMIVGFPTETEEDFNETTKNLTKIKFANMHLFPYSPRPFTVASKMKNVVSDVEKKRRLIELSTINQQFANQYLKQFIGKIVNVIFEHSKEKGMQIGHSEYSFTVKVKTNYDLTKKNKMVKLTRLTDGQLFGNLI